MYSKSLLYVYDLNLFFEYIPHIDYGRMNIIEGLVYRKGDGGFPFGTGRGL
jgi:hypothetical protein